MDEVFSRETLQSLSSMEVQIERQLRAYVERDVARIVKEIVRVATLGGTYYCAKGPYTNFSVQIQHSICTSSHPTGREILTDILKELNRRLPGCTFQVDPLKTYILIEWG